MKLTQSDLVEYVNFCNSQIAYIDRNLATLDKGQDEYYEYEKELKQYLNAKKIVSAVLVNNLPCKCEDDISFAIIGEKEGVQLQLILFTGQLNAEWTHGKPLNKNVVHDIWTVFVQKYRDYFSGCYIDMFPEVNDRCYLEMEKIGFKWGNTYFF